MPDTLTSPALDRPLRSLPIASTDVAEARIKSLIAGVGALKASAEAMLPTLDCEARKFVRDAALLLGDVASDLEGYSTALRDREEDEAAGFCMEGAE